MEKNHQDALEGRRGQHNFATLYDSLFCFENDWEKEKEDDETIDQDLNDNPTSSLLQHGSLWEGEEQVRSLLEREEEIQLYKILEKNIFLARARRNAVEWILTVNVQYSFSAVAAALAVNYLDRFLFSFHISTEKPWMIQLAAVACVSISAKMEETQVPFLLDLQVGGCKYVFEAKTIQRMEILVLSTLRWKMNPVTPFSFLDHFIQMLGFKDHLCWEFYRRCDLVLLSVLSDARSLHYPASTMATATLIYVIRCVQPSDITKFYTRLRRILGIHKDQVDGCTKLIVELESRDCDTKSSKRKLEFVPGSPSGVIDASFSSDSSNDSSEAASIADPLMKKMKPADSCYDQRTVDFLSTPR